MSNKGMSLLFKRQIINLVIRKVLIFKTISPGTFQNLDFFRALRFSEPCGFCNLAFSRNLGWFCNFITALNDKFTREMLRDNTTFFRSVTKSYISVWSGQWKLLLL